MRDYTGEIVKAGFGREKGGLFCVVGATPQGRLLLADGKRRKIARPKVKSLGHVWFIPAHNPFDHPAIQKLKQGEALSDKELRRALAAFRDQLEV